MRISRICAMGAAMLALASPGVSSRAAEPAGVRLYVFDCGVLLYNNVARFGYRPGEVSPTNLSDGCFLIDDPGKGALIWDTGVIPDRMWTAGGFPPKKEYAEGTIPLRDQLVKIGKTPANVGYVAVSHMHWDHVANLYQFANSTWLTSAYTRDHLLADTPGDKIDPSMFTGLKTTRTVMLPDDADYDVFGDGRAVIVPAPGHTPDSRVLVVRLKRHRPVILVGDLYHFRKDVVTDKAAATEDAPTLRRTRAKVQALAKRLGAELWISHDWREFARLKKAPGFYD